MNNIGDIKFCSKCIISNLRLTTTVESKHIRDEIKPTTYFDDDGVCDACRWAEIKKTKIDWAKREKELHELCDKHRSKDGSYDVVVPASGGKDSMYVAQILKTKLGMNPLTVTWAPHLWTETGIGNHQNLIQSGFDNILVSPNGEVHRKFTRLAFENLGHPFQPFIVGQRTVGPRIASQYGVKLIFYGENVAEYGNPLEDNYIPKMDPVLYTCFNINNPDMMLAGISIKELADDHGLKRSDMIVYNSLTLQDALEAELRSALHELLPKMCSSIKLLLCDEAYALCSFPNQNDRKLFQIFRPGR